MKFAVVANMIETGKPDAEPALPDSILFLCGMNSIRSPMAEQLARNILPKHVFIASAGVRPGSRDPFVDEVLSEVGLSLGDRQPQELDSMDDSYFDLIVSLAPDAHHTALEMTRADAIEVEYWPTADPTIATGTRNQILDAYREVRNRLEKKIRQRFTKP